MLAGLCDLVYLDYVVLSGRMIHELESIWNEAVIAQLTYYSALCQNQETSLGLGSVPAKI
jgi:hypothetical protein